MSVGVSEHHRLQRRSTDNVKVFEGCDALRQAPDEVEFYVDFLLDGRVALREQHRELCVFRAPVIRELYPAVQKYKPGEKLFIRVGGWVTNVSCAPRCHHVVAMLSFCCVFTARTPKLSQNYFVKLVKSTTHVRHILIVNIKL